MQGKAKARSIRLTLLMGFWLGVSSPAVAGLSLQDSADEATDERIIVLPEGPLADLLTGAPAEDVPVRLGGMQWPTWGSKRDPRWETEVSADSKEPWAHWATQLEQLASADSEPLARTSSRIRLAFLARQQGRDRAGWGHLLACRNRDMIFQALPAFLPGIAHRDSSPDAFDGTYRPALPPRNNPLDPNARTPIGNSMEHRAVHLGESVFAMKVQLEGDGIQVDLTHVSGPEVSFSVLPPEPEGLRIALLYADWVKLGTERQAVAVKLAPGDPTFTIWGRFLTREESSPIPRHGRLPAPDAARPNASIRLLVPKSKTEDRFLRALASFVARLTGLHVEVAHQQHPIDPRFPEPIDIHLGEGAALDKKVLELLDRLEEWVLAEANLRLLTGK